MDESSLLDELNNAQRQAVCLGNTHALVLAGAGSGKTRVLIHRIAWLLYTQQTAPYHVLAVTFTNKAAGEMRDRITTLAGMPLHALWMGTFHGICHRMLRTHWAEAYLSENFQILDSDDQLRLIKRLFKDAHIDEKRFRPRQAQNFINRQKDNALRAKDVKSNHTDFEDTMLQIYTAYEEACDRGDLVDFAEIILRTYELLNRDQTIRDHYQKRFEHILVDEFQDTNTIQYKWLKLLAGTKTKLFIVGDDDQSIYGWRGAKIENIHSFTKDYRPVETIRLEQNYRSTQTILTAANSIIDHNVDRLGKKLWTEQNPGELIKTYCAYNEIEEARFIAQTIESYRSKGFNLQDIAILYRSNAQSRVLEEALIQNGLPYRIYGGLRFFERAEIKDALAYLRLSQNPHDDAAFERVVNTPTRGIGDKTILVVREHAIAQRLSLWESAKELVDDASPYLTKRAKTLLGYFLELVANCQSHIEHLPLKEQVETVIQLSGLIEHFRKETGERGQARIENLAELVSAARQYEHIESDLSPLASFLAHAALEAGETQSMETDDYIHLMTMHSAKGLEFPLVFLSGVEEGLFPHSMSQDDPNRLEEERRLCYVGITRAMKALFITYTTKRRLKGKEVYHQPSRFLFEIPSNCIEELQYRSHISRPAYNNYRSNHYLPKQEMFDQSAHHALHPGRQVVHKTFGQGTVLSLEGHGEKARIEVNFDQAGSKWLLLEKAKLEPVG